MEKEPNPANCSVRIIYNNNDLGYIWKPEKTSVVEDPTDLFLDPSISEAAKILISARKIDV